MTSLTAPDAELPEPGTDLDAGPAGSATSGDGPPADGPPRRPPGSSVFSLDGRAAPGLYLVGWLASVLGLAILLALLLSAPGGTGGLVLALTSCALLAVGLVSAAGSQALERRARGSAYAGPSPVLVFVAALPIVIPLAVFALRLAEQAGVDPASPLGSVIGQAILIGGLIGLVRLVVVGLNALSWHDMAVRWPGLAAAAGHLASGAILAIPVILVTAILTAFLVSFVKAVPESPLPSTTESGGILLNFIAAGIIAPVGEEIFFRGFSLTAWERTLGWRTALIRSAVFFAIVHVLTVGGATFGDAASKALIAFVARLPVAFVLGWLFIRRRSIFAPIGLHATYNVLLLLIAQVAVR